MNPKSAAKRPLIIAANPGNHLAQLLQLIADGQISVEPGVRIVEIRHDDWCAIFEGGSCNCEPDIRVGQHLIKPFGSKRKHPRDYEALE